MRGDQKKYNFIIGEIAAALPGIAQAGASVYSAIKGGSGSQTNRVSPAPQTGDQAMVSNAFYDLVFGAFDPKFYLKTNPDIVEYWNETHPNKPISADEPNEEAIEWAMKHWEKYGKAEGRLGNDPATTKTYQDMVAEDTDYQKGVDQQLISDQQAAIDPFKEALAGTTADKIAANTAQNEQQTGYRNDYINQLAQDNITFRDTVSPIVAALSPMAATGPQQIGSAGGMPIFGVSGAQGYAQNQVRRTAGDILDSSNSLSDKTYSTGTYLADLLKGNAWDSAGATEAMNATNLGLDTGQNSLVNQINRIYTPNKAQTDYQNWLQQLMGSQDAMRYGTPSQTTSGSIGSDVAGGIAATIPGLLEITNNIMKNYNQPQTQQAPAYNGNNAESAFPTLFGQNPYGP